MTWGFSAASLLVAAVISFGLLLCLKPLLARYALARPNARSSHETPTPQGGGIAVVAAITIVLAGAAGFFPGQLVEPFRLGIVLMGAIGLAFVGAIDDVKPLHAVPRLLLQAAAVVAVIATLPPEMRIMPMLPWWLERLAVIIGGVWFVNVVNFMDGIDWMTVAEMVPVAGGLACFGLIGALPPDATLVAIGLCGALIGFAPLNRPVARIFLGDVGSLPIGLLLGWLLLLLAGRGHLAAAALLPLYYLADATITLLLRLMNGEPVTQAHRRHFYQRALDGGFPVYRIVGTVFALNVVLVGLGALSIVSENGLVSAAAILAGGALVGSMLWIFGGAVRKINRPEL